MAPPRDARKSVLLRQPPCSNRSAPCSVGRVLAVLATPLEPRSLVRRVSYAGWWGHVTLSARSPP